MVKQIVQAEFAKEKVITENSNEAREFFNVSRFGFLLDSGRIQLSLLEALYLIDKKRLEVLDGRSKVIDKDKFMKKAKKVDPNFLTKYAVFNDLRNRGYITKTALKFGADFRVYDRGVKPGEDHAKWVVFPVHEVKALTWHEFAAKNRVAHSTKKKLMIGVVDDEGDVSYWEVRWLRP
jgi:tRNA-intron endonuclease